MFKKFKRWWNIGKELLHLHKQLKEVTNHMASASSAFNDFEEDLQENRNIIIEGEIIRAQRDMKHSGEPQVATEARA